MRKSEDLLQKWNPTPEPLLELVFQNIDPSMIEEIAGADYGWRLDGHRAAILQLICEQNFSTLMDCWEPMEVLMLTQYTEPDDPNRDEGPTGIRGHWMRLFACTMLLRAAAETDNGMGFQDSAIIQLVRSSFVLGDDCARASLQFLTWGLQREPAFYRSPYLALALLLLAVSLRDYDRDRLEFLMDVLASTDRLPGAPFKYCTLSDSWRSLLRSIVMENSMSDFDFVKQQVAFSVGF